MDGKPVNLRQFRKRKAREDKARQAESNRVVHGTPNSLTELEQARREKLAREIDAKKRDMPDDSDSGSA